MSSLRKRRRINCSFQEEKNQRDRHIEDTVSTLWREHRYNEENEKVDKKESSILIRGASVDFHLLALSCIFLCFSMTIHLSF